MVNGEAGVKRSRPRGWRSGRPGGGLDRVGASRDGTPAYVAELAWVGSGLGSCIRDGPGKGVGPADAGVSPQGASMRRLVPSAGMSWRLETPDGQRTSSAAGGLSAPYPRKHADEDWL